MQRTKGGKKKAASGLDNNVDGGEGSSVNDGKESEDGSGAIKEKTKSGAKNNKRRNFTKNRQKKVSQSEKEAAASEKTPNDDDAGNSPSSKGKSVDEGTVSS